MDQQPNKRKLGRPRLPTHRVRSERVVTFLTPSEMEQLHKMADANDDTISAACHRILSGHLNKNAHQE